MELHELLAKTPEEVKELPIIEQLRYWQWKYEEVCRKINEIDESKGWYLSDIPENRKLIADKSNVGHIKKNLEYKQYMQDKYKGYAQEKPEQPEEESETTE